MLAVLHKKHPCTVWETVCIHKHLWVVFTHMYKFTIAMLIIILLVMQSHIQTNTQSSKNSSVRNSQNYIPLTALFFFYIAFYAVCDMIINMIQISPWSTPNGQFNSYIIVKARVNDQQRSINSHTFNLIHHSHTSLTLELVTVINMHELYITHMRQCFQMRKKRRDFVVLFK